MAVLREADKPVCHQAWISFYVTSLLFAVFIGYWLMIGCMWCALLAIK